MYIVQFMMKRGIRRRKNVLSKELLLFATSIINDASFTSGLNQSAETVVEFSLKFFTGVNFKSAFIFRFSSIDDPHHEMNTFEFAAIFLLFCKKKLKKL